MSIFIYIYIHMLVSKNCFRPLLVEHDPIWYFSIGLKPLRFMLYTVHTLRVLSTKQSGWFLGWSMDQEFPILPKGKVWSTWTSSVYIYTMSQQNHEKYRFWPTKNPVIYHRKTSKHVGFGGPWLLKHHIRRSSKPKRRHNRWGCQQTAGPVMWGFA